MRKKEYLLSTLCVILILLLILFLLSNIGVLDYKENNKLIKVLLVLGSGGALINIVNVGIWNNTYMSKLRKIKRGQEDDKKIILETLITFSNIIDAKDTYSKGHSARVALYSREIAKRTGMSGLDQDRIYYIALLHDIGKIIVPDEIINKPNALTPEERRQIEKHTIIGGEILKGFSTIPQIAEGAMFHHEKYDGTGYPQSLRGEEIPLFARIICVADSYDAMSSDRCYRKKLSDDKILIELEKFSGSQFDPDIVKYMIDMIEDGEVESIRYEEKYINYDLYDLIDRSKNGIKG